MGDNAVIENETKTPATPPEAPNGDGDMVGLVKSLGDTMTKLDERLGHMETQLEEASKPQYRHGRPNAFAIRKGEDIMSSRPYSMMRLAHSIRGIRKGGDRKQFAEHAKIEMDLSDRLQKAYYDGASWEGYGASDIICPLGADLMPTVDRETEEGRVIKGMTSEIVEECRQVMVHSDPYDPDELTHIFKSIGVQLRKDLSANTATTGANLIAMAAQGELIELLRAMEVMTLVGAQELDLPPQGAIRFPRSKGSVTFDAVTEGATISESTPTFGELYLSAKPYSALTDIPEELFKFATSVSVEAWLRMEMAREASLKTTQDMLTGPGGRYIKGLINYAGVRTLDAGTAGANGDTLQPEDPMRLFADIADQNTPVDRGFFFAMRNKLWTGLKTRKDNEGRFVFNVSTAAVGAGQRTRKALDGEVVETSTQIPADRVKGDGTDLTMLIAGIGAEWLIARAGVLSIDMTNSDASKFEQRLTTMRATQYIDAGPRHAESFGYIDKLLNQ